MPFNNDTQRKTAFFHALSFVLTDYDKNIAEESYKSAHSVRNTEVWVDTINYAATSGDATTEASSNSAVTKLTEVVAYPLDASNYQTWFFDTGSPSVGSSGYIPSTGFVKPWISPVDVPSTSGAPSNGFKFVLYVPDGSGGTVGQVNPTTGFWEVDYFAGLLKFQQGNTPKDDATYGIQYDTAQFSNPTYHANNAPRATLYYYTGQFLSDVLTGESGSIGYYDVNVNDTSSASPIINSSAINVTEWKQGSELEIEINGISSVFQETGGTVSSDTEVYFSTSGATAIGIGDLSLDGTEDLYLNYDGTNPKTGFEISSSDGDRLIIVYTKA